MKNCIKGNIISKESACIKFYLHGYELSIANDTSCAEDGVIRRSSLIVFKDDENITKEFFDVDEMYGVTPIQINNVMNDIIAANLIKEYYGEKYEN